MRRLFILRPEPAASATAQRATEIGLQAVVLPLFAIEPLPWDLPEPARFDALLLTSANTLRYAGDGLPQLRGLPAHCVGETTSAAAREAGFGIASVGEEGIGRLLASIDPDLRLLHLCGEHRTSVEAAQEIHHIPVYRAAELPPPDLKQIEGQTVTIHSARSARRLAEIADRQGLDRPTVRIAAISEAVAAAAGSGWETCEAAGRPDSGTLLALAARLCQDRSRA